MGKSGRSFDLKEKRTKAADRQSTDIRTAVERDQIKLDLPAITGEVMVYGDFSNVPDMQTAMNMVIAAEDLFMKIPPAIRRQFDDNVATFVEGVTDPTRADEMIELGLIPDSGKVPVEAPPAPLPPAESEAKPPNP